MEWSERFSWREKVHHQFPEVWGLKIVRKRIAYIAGYLRDGESVLDVGASDRGLEKRLKAVRPRMRYKSMDVDPSYTHDYASLEEIKETFDLILLFEVIEHVDLKTGGEMVKRFYRLLNPGGRVILSTPNIYTPARYWRGVDHVTAYHYEELGAVFLSEGFEIVDIRRVYNDTVLNYLMKVYVFAPLFHFLGIDFTKSILLVAQKRPKA
jgi:SAM-dependent methyltransferase